MMLHNTRRPSSSSRSTCIFWPADDVDSQSTVSSSVQPVIDAGKQRRSSTTDETVGRQSYQMRSALGDLLFRRLNTTLSQATTVVSPTRIAAANLLPEKYEMRQTTQAVGRDNCSRSVSAPPRPKWTCSGNTTDATDMPVSRSGSIKAVVHSRSDDGYAPWCRNSDETARRNSVELYGTMRRSSEPYTGLTKYPSATSLSTLDRHRLWISKHLQQFAETDDRDEQSMPRRKGSVAALINSFEQCALQYTTVEPASSTAVPRSGPGRETIHGSLTNIDSIGRIHGRSNSSDKLVDDNSGSGTPPSARSTKLFTSNSVPRSMPYGECVKMWKTKDDHAKVDDAAANNVRRSSVDEIRRPLHNLDSIGRVRKLYSRSEKAAEGNSGSTRPRVARTEITSTKSRPFTRDDLAEVNDEHVSTVRRSSSVDIVSPAAPYTVSFNPKPGPPVQPHQQRRFLVLIGTGHLNNSDSSTKTGPVIADARKEAPDNFTGTVNHRETNDGCEAGDRSSKRTRNTAGLPRADCCYRSRQKTNESSEYEGGSIPRVGSLPVANTHCTSTSRWVDKSIPSFAATDDDFESFSQYDGTSSLRRTGSLVSDSNNTEDSGVALSEFTSPVVDWTWSDQKAADNGGGWSRYRSKTGPRMTCRGDEDDKTSTTSYSTTSSHDHADIKLTQSKSVLHGMLYDLTITLRCHWSTESGFDLACFIYLSVFRSHLQSFVTFFILYLLVI